MFVHFFIGQQRFFGGKWWATVLRYLAIGLTYPLIIAIVAFTALLGAVFL